MTTSIMTSSPNHRALGSYGSGISPSIKERRGMVVGSIGSPIQQEPRRLHRLKKQLSIGNIKRKFIPPLKSDDSCDDDHLLEQVEPVSVSDSNTNGTNFFSNANNKNNKKNSRSKSRSRSHSRSPTKSATSAHRSSSSCCSSSRSSSESKQEHSRNQIPSSLVTLTEEEKRQLEDVLMRIGLKDCGL